MKIKRFLIIALAMLLVMGVLPAAQVVKKKYPVTNPSS